MLAGLAADSRIGSPTAHRCPHERVDVLAAAAGLRGALPAARAAGRSPVTVDGTRIRTDRCRAPRPTARTDLADARVDPWWSGEAAGRADACR
ncbi:hypothetical protein GCM10027451_29940 [Geodermatophilus aquaeductus]